MIGRAYGYLVNPTEVDNLFTSRSTTKDRIAVNDAAVARSDVAWRLMGKVPRGKYSNGPQSLGLLYKEFFGVPHIKANIYEQESPVDSRSQLGGEQ